MDAPGPTDTDSRPHALPLPTTFGGVAALASGPPTRLRIWQTLIAAISAGILVWAFQATWGRALEHAAASLPARGEIRQGALVWEHPAPLVLHQGAFLSLVIDPHGTREIGQAADVTLSLEASHLGIRSLFGWTQVPYPRNGRFSLSRTEASAQIAAWRTPLLALLGALIVLGLAIAWLALALLHTPILATAAFLVGRPLSLGVAWQLAQAALLPGALLMAAAVALYASRQLSLVGLLVALPLHLVAGWIFAAGGAWKLTRPPASPPANPFRPPDPEPLPAPTDAVAPENPFISPR
ncbi:MAG: hypothetical protein KF833_04655 [Verrucomicrobiae bacterium]|nr:hypothetical protein [Verrucomicrobiae bacterium]